MQTAHCACLALYLFFALHHALGRAANTVHKDYCVVGAGPGGLQMGYYLKHKNRDFVILEKNNISGSFFVNYPRHRKLISINKFKTGHSNKEFNMRHDWNSILSDYDGNSQLFTSYSDQYFPPADRMLDYLSDYQRKFGIDVKFNTEVRNIKHNKNDTSCKISMEDQLDNQYCCGTAIISTGIITPITLDFKGSEWIEGYEDMSVNPKDFEDDAVLILGRGNSAFETAQNLYGHAAFVHILGRSRLRMSWETHYVGDIRGVNNEILDAYMLKSLDGVLEISTEEMYFTKREDGKIMVRSTPFPEFQISDFNGLREGYDRVIRCLGFRWDSTIFHNSTKHRSALPKQKPEYYTEKPPVEKYPEIKHDYESTQYDGIYFAGTMSHSLDSRKSAGGFVHGFRYTARALHRILEWKNHGIKWPAKEKPVSQIALTFINRANEAHGLYQMFATLADVAIYDRERKTMKYLEEFPIYLLPKFVESTGYDFDPEKHGLIVMDLEYGANFSAPGEDKFNLAPGRGGPAAAHRSNFLHPVAYYFSHIPTEEDFAARSPYEIMPKPKAIVHILEDFTTLFNGETTHFLPMRKFVEFIAETDLRMFGAQSCFEFRNLGGTETRKLPDYCRRYLTLPPNVLMYASEA